MKKCTNIPITCKIRTGWTKNEDEAHLLIPKVIDSGASLVTLHGRSRVCRYTGLARWDYIKDCVGATGDKVPFLGNGDVFHWSDFYDNIENYGVASCMIGRGALIKPWIFEEIKEKRTIDKSSTERLDMLKTFVNYGLEHWGADKQGVANTRRFLLEWLSFLCRYIPVGIIDGSRQVMNKRPPPYFGRNELGKFFTFIPPYFTLISPPFHPNLLLAVSTRILSSFYPHLYCALTLPLFYSFWGEILPSFSSHFIPISPSFTLILPSSVIINRIFQKH